jgi:hypothetical protein
MGKRYLNLRQFYSGFKKITNKIKNFELSSNFNKFII